MTKVLQFGNKSVTKIGQMALAIPQFTYIGYRYGMEVNIIIVLQFFTLAIYYTL